MSTPALQQVIAASLTAKKHFIEIDEFDKKERLLLNFGHTFGHAIEGASNYAIPHGIGVGLGILCSLAFQRSRGITHESTPIVAEPHPTPRPDDPHPPRPRHPTSKASTSPKSSSVSPPTKNIPPPSSPSSSSTPRAP